MADPVTFTHHDVAYAGGVKKIHYLAAGPVDGPLIIFIHGWPGIALSWSAQLRAFASIGFRAIAPDMPGYGKSTARRIVDDYCQEALVEGMMALLGDTGRDAAIWVGHDWGSGVTSSVATQHPKAVKALVSLTVPFRTIELGPDKFVPLVNRELYPADQYEFAQWDYWKFYEESFEKAVAWFEKDVAGFLKSVMPRTTTPPTTRFYAPVVNIRKAGTWFGLAQPPPVEATGPAVMPPDDFDALVAAMQKTGFWGASAYYMNNKRNAEYNGNALSGGKLTQPVLFVHAVWDLICDTKTSRLPEPMREACSNLTEVSIEAGHFVQNEKPGELNAALFRFILEELPGEWPGYWDRGYTKRKMIA